MPTGRHDACPLMPQPQSAACFTASCRGSATGRISEARPRRALGGPTPSSGGCSGGSGVTRGSAARRRRGRRRRNSTASRRVARVSGRIHHASCVRPVISINCSVCHGPPLEAPSPPLLPCHALQRQPRFQRDPSASPKSDKWPQKGHNDQNWSAVHKFVIVSWNQSPATLTQVRHPKLPDVGNAREHSPSYPISIVIILG